MIQRNVIAFRKLREWAGRRHSVETTFAVGDSARLADLCRSSGLAERLHASWSFELGLEGFPLVRVRAAGALKLKCQRCLAPVRLPVEVDCKLTIVAGENEIGEVASPYDTVVAGPGGLVLGTILEDEILTSLAPGARTRWVYGLGGSGNPLIAGCKPAAGRTGGLASARVDLTALWACSKGYDNGSSTKP